ncbi:hypothetical protein BH23GEM6_BH23GEM6_12090 [soil metagenome]
MFEPQFQFGVEGGVRIPTLTAGLRAWLSMPLLRLHDLVGDPVLSVQPGYDLARG